MVAGGWRLAAALAGGWKAKKPLPSQDCGFHCAAGRLGFVLRPESMSPPEAVWLLGFLGKLICDMDTLLFRVMSVVGVCGNSWQWLNPHCRLGFALFDMTGWLASRLIEPKILL